MKLLVNDKEIAKFLCELVSVRDACQHTELADTNVQEIVEWVRNLQSKNKFNLDKHRDKIKQKLNNAVKKDLKIWIQQIKNQITQHKLHYYKNINQHAPIIINKIGHDKIFANYKIHHSKNFVKTVGFSLDPAAEMVRRADFSSVADDCLLRNTVGNETLLVEKIDKKFPFWFIDSGYTNFVESNKKWHRLVQNHLHFNKMFVAPADRLSNFTKFPQPWRPGGSKILIVEPGEFAAGIFHVEAKSWGQQVSEELKKHTDRPVEFRSKTNKKTRKSLYQQLLTEDYYCTVSINSNSAIESIWAGIPAITLDKHASNSVTRNSLDQINNLYYGPLGDWLAWLSYCQFTFDELMDGTALNIIKKYHV